MAKHNMIANLKEAQLESGGKVFDWGTSVPSDAVVGYAKGAMFIDTGNGILYINEGTYSSCAFEAIPLTTTLQDLLPTLSFSGTDDTDGTGTMDIQVKDAAGNNLAERFAVRTWIADADFSEADAQTDYSVTVGEELDEIEADADYDVITTAAGLITMNINRGSAGTVYVMAELDGRIYSESLAITGP